MLIVQIAIFFIFALPISYFLGRTRQIGFGWSLFFCLFLTVFGGFVITMLSRKYYDPNPAPSKAKLVLGWIIGIFFFLISILTIFSIVNSFDSFIKVSQTQRLIVLNQIVMTIGLSGLGFYLVGLAKGKKFNSEYSKPMINH